jgi:acyl-CoA synthetase (AMP-forming)/AMP-acid ligase II
MFQISPGEMRTVSGADEEGAAFCSTCRPASTWECIEYADGSATVSSGTCGQIIVRALHAFANRQLFGRERLTYGDAGRRIAWCLQQLQGTGTISFPSCDDSLAGFEKGARAVIFSDTNTCDWTFWACALVIAGLVAVPLAGSLSADIVERLITSVNPCVVIASKRCPVLQLSATVMRLVLEDTKEADPSLLESSLQV